LEKPQVKRGENQGCLNVKDKRRKNISINTDAGTPEEERPCIPQ
jgi:hypothetical protein